MIITPLLTINGNQGCQPVKSQAINSCSQQMPVERWPFSNGKPAYYSSDRSLNHLRVVSISQSIEINITILFNRNAMTLFIVFNKKKKTEFHAILVYEQIKYELWFVFRDTFIFMFVWRLWILNESKMLKTNALSFIK